MCRGRSSFSGCRTFFQFDCVPLACRAFGRVSLTRPVPRAVTVLICHRVDRLILHTLSFPKKTANEYRRQRWARLKNYIRRTSITYFRSISSASCRSGIIFISVDRIGPPRKRTPANSTATCRRVWCRSLRRRAIFWCRSTTRTTSVTATMRQTCSTTISVHTMWASQTQDVEEDRIAAARTEAGAQAAERERPGVADIIVTLAKMRNWVMCWYRQQQVQRQLPHQWLHWVSGDRPRISSHIIDIGCRWVSNCDFSRCAYVLLSCGCLCGVLWCVCVVW